MRLTGAGTAVDSSKWTFDVGGASGEADRSERKAGRIERDEPAGGERVATAQIAETES
jgi:hypothetical protein